MVGLGTVINAGAIVAGGLAGYFFGGLLPKHHQDALSKTCGVCTLFIGAGGALEGMLKVEGASLHSGGAMLIVACLVLGALIGETLDIDGKFESFGEWLKVRTGNSRDGQFVDGFVTASLTVCIGAMAIVGSIQDGILGDYSILATKAVLDLIIVMVMTCSLGKGCIFSALPVALLQGGMTALARLIKPLMTAAALSNLSLIGSILIFCVGLNLIWGKMLRVGNLLPALLIAVAAAFLPF